MKITNKLFEADKIKRYKDIIEKKLIPALRAEIGLAIRPSSVTEDTYHLKYNATLNDYFHLTVEFLTTSRLDNEYPVFAHLTYRGLREPVGSLDFSDIPGCVDMFNATIEEVGIVNDSPQAKGSPLRGEQTVPQHTSDCTGPITRVPYKVGEDGETEVGYIGDGYVFNAAGNLICKIGGTDSRGNKIIVGKYN